MIVMKFGGSSLATGERIRYVTDLVLRSHSRAPVVVVSAMGGVTDSLIGIARLALQGRKVLSSVEEHLGSLHERHLTALAEVADGAVALRVREEIDNAFVELREICTGIALLGELSPRSIDAVSAYGEKLAAPIVAAAIEARGHRATPVSAEELLLTDANHGRARPLIPASRVRTRERLLPLIEDGIIPVVTGFIGATEDGITTTVGRNGSDYSASIFGALLGAEEVWKWTDADGILSADPREVPGVQPLPLLSYAEAAELAYFGSRVLHPAAIVPAVEAGVPFRIVNSFNPDHPGTLLTRDPETSPHAVKAVTAIHDLALVTVQGVGMAGVIGAAARVFGAVAQVNVNVLMISQASSESNICLVVPAADLPKVEIVLRQHLAEQLNRHEVDHVATRTPVAIVTVVGSGMAGTPGIAGRLFSCMGANGINIVAIAQGSTELSISFVVDDEQSLAAVRSAHREFVEDLS
ncbi:MAG: aspartate kinase [Chloroflexi bacterium]|jgi:aspartate kinase|nr:aspartate kinase [Chloroflexota bacterium]